MGKKEYPCHLSNTKMCIYGGNKVYNYGFVSGVSGYCRHKTQKRFIDNLKECPVKEQIVKESE